MASGLSRRRVAASSSSTSLSSPTPSSTNSVGGTLSNTNVNGGGHAGSAFEGGTRIAYDPRDLASADSEQQPKLTLMEEVLLLGIKDKQGYLSFWNDNISYALRGCILLELALRRRIMLVNDPNRRHLPLAERLVEVRSDKLTGETILDETLRMMKSQESVERLSVGSWIDLLSGETWNVLKIGFQLKQVRERLAKGLVDKGVLRTEKRNFLLFDMATHPVADVRTKESIITRVVSLLTATTSTVPPEALGKEEAVKERTARAVCLVCAAYTASVLDNAFGRLGYEEREGAFQRCDEILAEFSVWPFGSESGVGNASNSRRRNRIAEGSRADGREAVIGLVSQVKREAGGPAGEGEDTTFELVAAVLDVLAKLDSLI
ncbi:Golgi phosphoprotein 3-domain-containing protein [Armillaria nabsnona]|nr:Golgi phosphoprotein 3-domain-containing protein [Armillaria nabsnona]